LEVWLHLCGTQIVEAERIDGYCGRAAFAGLQAEIPQRSAGAVGHPSSAKKSWKSGTQGRRRYMRPK
jgi:hypothetical protein